MSTFGYGKKTYIQALAKLACHMSVYIAKHNATLQRYLPGSAYTCLSSIASCLTALCNLKNTSER